MKKVVGYVVAISGLVIMALGFGTFKINVGIFNDVSASILTGLGVVLIIVGVVISLVFDKRKNKQAKEEVPIFEGKGKDRKIVGYQRA